MTSRRLGGLSAFFRPIGLGYRQPASINSSGSKIMGRATLPSVVPFVIVLVCHLSYSNSIFTRPAGESAV